MIAIIITIMVLELKVPHGDDLRDLSPLLPVFLSYVLSFVYVGIYWVSEALYVTVALVWLIPGPAHRERPAARRGRLTCSHGDTSARGRRP